jgi:hypothetical protein
MAYKTKTSLVQYYFLNTHASHKDKSDDIKDSFCEDPGCVSVS